MQVLVEQRKQTHTAQWLSTVSSMRRDNCGQVTGSYEASRKEISMSPRTTRNNSAMVLLEILNVVESQMEGILDQYGKHLHEQTLHFSCQRKSEMHISCGKHFRRM
jgi:hypothetical protein